MKRIPIAAARRIAEEYGYDQVMIYARKVGDDPAPHGEHMTTYGVNKIHCDVMARIGSFLKYKIMGWVEEQKKSPKMFTCPHCGEVSEKEHDGYCGVC